MADQLKRIADKLDGGDPNVGTPTEEGNLKRIADYIVENGMGGGSGILYVNVVIGVYDENEGYAPLISCDKTYSEIIDWIDNNGSVVVKGYHINDQEEPMMYQYTIYTLSYVNTNDKQIDFRNFESNGFANIISIWNNAEDSSYWFEQYTLR